MFNVIKKVFKKSSAKECKVIPYSEHAIDHNALSQHAVKVIEELTKHGYDAYLVGGAVRDLLAGIVPKDYDIVTNAKPLAVKKIFRSSIIIGRRFKLVHVRFGKHIIEVATFRGNDSKFFISKKRATNHRGMLVRDNVYGDMESDVWRRDFAANALYYDLKNKEIIDYVSGFEDIKARRLRVIGDPEARYREDPVRMIRSIRYATKLGFKLDESNRACIRKMKGLLATSSSERLLVEFFKTFHSGCGMQSFAAFREYKLTELLLPQVEESITAPKYKHTLDLIMTSLYHTDVRVNTGNTLNNAYLFIVMLWPQLQHNMFKKSGDKAIRLAIANTLKSYNGLLALPKNISETCEEIWHMQYQMQARDKKEILGMLNNNKFRMAYDFLMLRAQVEPNTTNLAIWWHRFVAADDSDKMKMLDSYARNNIRNSRSGGFKPRRKRKT